MISVLSALALAAAPAAPQSADPLEPARRGLMECQTPDAARKTCSVLTRYAFEPDGRVIIQGTEW